MFLNNYFTNELLELDFTGGVFDFPDLMSSGLVLENLQAFAPIDFTGFQGQSEIVVHVVW